MLAAIQPQILQQQLQQPQTLKWLVFKLEYRPMPYINPSAIFFNPMTLKKVMATKYEPMNVCKAYQGLLPGTV